MKRVVSVSLGSSKRDHEAEVELLGERVHVRRVGTDGDLGRARALISELDGKVDAIGLGGIDLHLVAAGRRYLIRDAKRLADAAERTPVVDGGYLKMVVDRETLYWLRENMGLDFRGRKVLQVSATDRYGMARAFVELGANVLFGDLKFAFGLPWPLTIRGVDILGTLFLPLICRLPFEMLYPTGEKQKEWEPWDWRPLVEAEIIAGDFLYIRRHAPRDMTGKIVITNTVTAEDVEFLRSLGTRMLVTSTPEWGGRSFGVNVLEAALVAISGRRPEELGEEDFKRMLKEMGWRPRVEVLN